jgi:hypothetical protein
MGNEMLSFLPGLGGNSSPGFGVDMSNSNALGGAGSAMPDISKGVNLGQADQQSVMSTDYSLKPGMQSQDFGNVQLDGNSAQSGILSDDYDVMGGDSFDYKTMVSGIAKSMAGGKASSQGQSSIKPQLGIPKSSQAQAVMLPTGLSGSSAMSAIQGGGMSSIIGGQPTRDELLSKMMGR